MQYPIHDYFLALWILCSFVGEWFTVSDDILSLQSEHTIGQYRRLRHGLQ